MKPTHLLISIKELKSRMKKLKGHIEWHELNDILQSSEKVIPNITERIKQLKRKGYQPRFTGGMVTSEDWMTCDCCERKTKSKAAYEADYPKNPDLGLCSLCTSELYDLYRNNK